MGSFYAISELGAQTLLAPLDRFPLTDCQRFASNQRELQLCRVGPERAG